MMHLRTIVSMGVLCLLPFSAQALLQTCVVASGGLAFGSYSFIDSSPTTAVGNVAITCSLLSGLGGETVSYNISLSTGNSGSYVSRKMISGTYHLQYNLHTQSGANGSIWGDGTSGTSTVQDSYSLGLLGSVIRNYPVYGRIASGQNLPLGAYTDNLTITVNY